MPRCARSRGPRSCCSSTCARVASMSLSYCTPEGHAVTHAMHPRHWSKCCTIASSSGSPSTSCRIRWMRPRGESISSPQSRYVGQDGRQKPQCTQSATSCGSGPSDATDEPPRAHPAVRVELRLDAAHHGESTYGSPYVELGLDIGRCVDDDNRALVLSDVAA